MFRMDRHKYAVTSLSWYPADNGLFVTSSYDSTIKVWDTNEMKVTFNLKIRGERKLLMIKRRWRSLIWNVAFIVKPCQVLLIIHW